MTNTEKNKIPDKVRTIHLTAVCGTGMGALACMLRDMGFEITGSDQNVYPPMSDFLEKKGVKLTRGFHPQNLDHDPDLVIVGNAVTRDNPESKAMYDKGLHYCSMPQAIRRFVANNKKMVVITGTHGKTTTSSLIAWILCEAGLDPAFIIGGILKNFDSNYRTGNGDYVVLEGDEYDTAFFDKGPKFLHYPPSIAVLTSIEFDHADIFKDIAHVRQAFDTFVSSISPENTLFTFAEDTNVTELLHNKSCKSVSYGRNSGAFWQLGDFFVESSHIHFSVLKAGKHFSDFSTSMMGEHNLLNTVAAIAIADHLNIPAQVIDSALKTFKGVRRRQEIRGQKRGIIVIDDFAHHPTAVKETLRAARHFYPDKRLIAVFEPRTNTSMRKIFQDIYPLSFDDADMVCIRNPSRLDKVPVNERFSSENLVADLKHRGKDAYHFTDTDAVMDFLVRTAQYDDVILIMSNGGFDNIHERLLERL